MNTPDISDSDSSGRRAPTMEDVARRAGVSRALVSLVMRDSPKVSEHRRQAVLKAAAELDYRPNAAARNLAQKRTRTLGVVINDLHNPFFADVVDGINAEANRSGFRLLMNMAYRDGQNEIKAIDTFLEHRVEAILVLGSQANPKLLQQKSKLTPIIVIGSAVGAVDSVVNDDALGSQLVVDHLVGLGHSRIAHIDGGSGAGASERRRGFGQAMADHGLEPVVVAGEFTEQSGSNGADDLLNRNEPPTAIFAANDLAAVGAINRIRAAGLRNPEDVSVVGYDNAFLAGLGPIGLTTIDQPRVEMGRVGTRLVIERSNDELDLADTVHLVLKPKLVVRGSTASPGTAGRG